MKELIKAIKKFLVHAPAFNPFKLFGVRNKLEWLYYAGQVYYCMYFNPYRAPIRTFVCHSNSCKHWTGAILSTVDKHSSLFRNREVSQKVLYYCTQRERERERERERRH